MEGGTSGGYNHQRGKAVTDNDYNDKNTTAATTIMRSCSSCNLGVLCRMLTKCVCAKQQKGPAMFGQS